MGQQKVLVIEDDAAVRRVVVDALRWGGYAALEADRGDTGQEMALKKRYDLLLLDLMLPEKDGLEILREVRAARPKMPVIILTARGEERDRIKGLRLGADDYVVKPFSVKELLARVEAVLRRTPERPGEKQEIKVPGGVVDLARGEVRFRKGKSSVLSKLETDLLRYLANNPGRPVPREELLSRVWRMNPEGIETRTIDMHIARLRDKLRDDPEKPRVLVTLRGKGYMFTTKGKSR